MSQMLGRCDARDGSPAEHLTLSAEHVREVPPKVMRDLVLAPPKVMPYRYLLVLSQRVMRYRLVSARHTSLVLSQRVMRYRYLLLSHGLRAPLMGYVLL